VEDEAVCTKWHLGYKTSNISETKQSRAKLLQSIYRKSCVGARRNLVTLGVWPIEIHAPNFVNFAMRRHASVLHWYTCKVFYRENPYDCRQL